MIIGCVNLAGLLTARAVGRRKEMAIRTALGATASRLVRQLLTEAGLLGSFGGLLGVGVADATVRAVRAVSPSILPRAEQVHLDGVVLAFAAVLSVATALAFGVIPAWRVTRMDVHTRLKDEGQGAGVGRGSSRAHASLVVLEVALATILLVPAV
jgi:ABC-type antimicrobial peptide transport system permease subunit